MKNKGKIRFFPVVWLWVWELLTKKPLPKSHQRRQLQWLNWWGKLSIIIFPTWVEARLHEWNLHFYRWLCTDMWALQVATPMPAPLRAVRALARRGKQHVGYVCPALRARPTYGFRFIRRLDLFAFKFLPINVPEECMLFDVTFTFRSTTQTFARVFGHQLWEKEKHSISWTSEGDTWETEVIPLMN